MSFSLIKSGGWAFGEILLSGQMNALDTDHANALDGLNGGLYALVSALILGGAGGLSVTTPFQAPGAGIFNIRNQPGVDPTGTLSSTTAIQNALNAAAAAGGGRVLTGPGRFLHGTLGMPSNVSLEGVPDATFFIHDHASSVAIGFQSYNEGNPAVIQDIRFLGNVATTGTHINNNTGARVVFLRCTWNGVDFGGGTSSNLQGKLIRNNHASSQTLLIDCRLNVAAPALAGVDAALGKVTLVRGRVAMPATYAESLVAISNGGRAVLDGVDFDLTAYAGAGPVRAVYAASSGAILEMDGCHVDVTGASPTNLVAVQWVDGAVVKFGPGNRDTGLTSSYALHGSAQAAIGSQIALRPSLAFAYGAVATIDLTGVHYRNIMVSCTAASGPAITLPTGLFPGDWRVFTYYNAPVSASAVVPTFATTPVTGTAVPTVGAGNTLTGVFVWESLNGSSYRWVQKGTWGVGLTLA